MNGALLSYSPDFTYIEEIIFQDFNSFIGAEPIIKNGKIKFCIWYGSGKQSIISIEAYYLHAFRECFSFESLKNEMKILDEQRYIS